MGPLSSLVGLLALIAFVWAGMVFWPVSQTPDFRPPKLSLVSLGLPARWPALRRERSAGGNDDGYNQPALGLAA